MISLELIYQNLSNPAVISFGLGAAACLMKSDLRVPQQTFETISMYLLFSIGLKGGMAIYGSDAGTIAIPLLVTTVLGCLTPVLAFLICRHIGKLTVTDSAAMAAHSGSVSAVTFIAAQSFAELSQTSYDGYLTALLVVLEILGIVVAILLANTLEPGRKISLRRILHECLTGKSVILLFGGMLVGIVSDRTEIAKISRFFIPLFHGILLFFMLELGVLAAKRIREIKSSLFFMLAYGTLVPLLFGVLGIAGGSFAGMSVGNTAILATMVASASYIAAPAAVRMALPDANPGIYLTTSISITLPFNIALGIPLYFSLARFAATF